MKKVMVLALAVVLGGCATPPGQLDDNNLEWSETTVYKDVSTVVNNYRLGFRQCGRDFGQAEYYTSDKKALIDVYVSSLFGGKSNWVMAKIEAKEITDSETKIRVGMQNRYDSQKIRKIWLSWADGDLRCK